MNLKLKPGNHIRAAHGHPWVFASDIQKHLASEFDGQGLGLIDAQGRFLGSGIYNSHSQIIWRRYSRKQVKFDSPFLKQKIADAIAKRATAPYRRVVWSDADDLPGLVVDQYDDTLVMQPLTLAMDQRQKEIVSILQEVLNPKEIIIRTDAPTRKYEGLSPHPLPETVDQESTWPRSFTIDNIQYSLNLQTGQKTGFYLDQREQHPKIAKLSKNRSVLDGFCNQGAFALHCCKAGAREITAIDISADCIQNAKHNATLNNSRITFQCENMFDFFSKNRKMKFDLIILDPPSFARNKASLDGALRGYKELNLRALRMLTPGGHLATYSCSQHVSRPLFMDMLESAAIDARRNIYVRERVSQPPDHPIRLDFPESEYLKGAILEVE